MLDFLSTAWIEVLGVISSLIYLYFSVRQDIWLWPFGILSSGFFIYIFFTTGFYADTSLQGYYLVISCYGWYHWVYGKRGEKDKSLPVSRASVKVLIISFIIFIILFTSMAQVLDRLTDSDVPWGDAFTTAGSIIATWMLARKIIEHWLLWIVIDTVAAALYLYKAMYPTTVLYVIYTGIAVVGYFQWKRTYSHE